MSYRSGRHFLQIPGPTNVPDRVLRAMDRPTIDHRGPAFAELTRDVLTGLKDVFGTTSYGTSAIYLIDVDGTNLVRLSNDADSIQGLSWR